MERNNLMRTGSMKDHSVNGRKVMISNGGSNNNNNRKKNCNSSGSSVQGYGDDYLSGFSWPPRSYTCSFCKREFRSAQALGGHMNVHRRDRARLRQSPLMDNASLNLINPKPNPNFSFPPPFVSSSTYGLTSLPSLSSSPRIYPLFSPPSPSPKREANQGILDTLFDPPITRQSSNLAITTSQKKQFFHPAGNEVDGFTGNDCHSEFSPTTTGPFRSSKEDLDLELRLGY